MRSIVSLILLIFLSCSLSAQEKIKKSEHSKTLRDSTEIYLMENDSIFSVIELEEVVVTPKDAQAEEERRKFLILQRRVLKVYPYAKSGAENLTMLNRNMAKMSTSKEKKRYFKIVEDYLEVEFEEQLKKLSRKEGQILVKLIHRQTGKTTYDLIKELKSGWKAFWSNNTAKVFDINLKTEYDPMSVTEDFLIESILTRAFSEGRLDSQPSALDINYAELSKVWKEKVENAKAKQ
ncbi:MAG: DUF4294 domain-containing protein [Flavobacteriaceae bacterium]|jgi:hypothetical protein|nr:DUF4294 domain-containing protein [Flavobacteriaceae bacterium]